MRERVRRTCLSSSRISTLPLVAAASELHDGLSAAGATDLVDLDSLETGGAAITVDAREPEAPFCLLLPRRGCKRTRQRVVTPFGTGDLRRRERFADSVRSTGRTSRRYPTTSSSFQLVKAMMPVVHVGASIGLAAGSTTDGIWAMASHAAATVLVAYPLTLADVVNAPQALSGSSSFRLAMSGSPPLAPRIKRGVSESARHRSGGELRPERDGRLHGHGQPQRRRAQPHRIHRGSAGCPDRPTYIGASSGDELPFGEVGEALVPDGYFSHYKDAPDRTAETLAGGVLHTGGLRGFRSGFT